MNQVVTKEPAAVWSRPKRPDLRCTLCGQEILEGEEYWYCNGACICGECLPEFARQELAPCRLRRGTEAGL